MVRRMLALVVMLAGIGLAVVLAPPIAAACGEMGDGCAEPVVESGAGTVVVQVEQLWGGSRAGGSSGGSSSAESVRVRIPARCWYRPGETGAEYYGLFAVEGVAPVPGVADG